jgi:hypothetical protein
MARIGSTGITSDLPVTPAQSELKAESSQHFATPKACDSKSSATEILDNPFSFKSNSQQSRPQRSTDVGPPLTPIQAGTGKAAPQPPRRLDVNAKHGPPVGLNGWSVLDTDLSWRSATLT